MSRTGCAPPTRVGYWDNNTYSSVQTYLTNASGNQTFGGVRASPATPTICNEQHLMNAVSLKTDTGGNWDFEADRHLVQLSAGPAAEPCRRARRHQLHHQRPDRPAGWHRLGDPGSSRAIWRPIGPGGAHEVSFGLHHDQYMLNNPTYNAPNWLTSSDNGNNTLVDLRPGKTETYGAVAAGGLEASRRAVKLTLGGRCENWRAPMTASISPARRRRPADGAVDQLLAQGVALRGRSTRTGAPSSRSGRPSAIRRWPSSTRSSRPARSSPFPIPTSLPESALSFEFAIERQTRTPGPRLAFRGANLQRPHPADQPDQQRLHQHLAECRPDPQSRRRGLSPS